jgi:hypothetical protein
MSERRPREEAPAEESSARSAGSGSDDPLRESLDALALMADSLVDGLQEEEPGTRFNQNAGRSRKPWTL